MINGHMCCKNSERVFVQQIANLFCGQRIKLYFFSMILFVILVLLFAGSVPRFTLVSL